MNLNKQMTSKQNIIFVIVTIIAVFISMQIKIVYGQFDSPGIGSEERESTGNEFLDLLQSQAEANLEWIENVMDSRYHRDLTIGHGRYFIGAEEIDGYSKDMLMIYEAHKNNQTIPDQQASHITDLMVICGVHESRQPASFEFEKKLENCDLLDEYNEALNKKITDALLNNHDRDYRDKE